jgi:hypothetical protein
VPARILRLTERFNRDVRRLGATSGTPAGRAVSDLLRALLAAELPAAQDRETLMPPVARYWFRRVPGHNLWLYFAFSVRDLDEDLELIEGQGVGIARFIHL